MSGPHRDRQTYPEVPPTLPPPPWRLAQRGPLWRHLGVCLGLCPRALPREECSRNDKAARGLRDGPVQAPPTTNSETEAPSQEASCLKSPRVRASGQGPSASPAGLSAVRLPSRGEPSALESDGPGRILDLAERPLTSGAGGGPWHGSEPPSSAASSHKCDIRGSVLWAGLWVEGRAPASAPAWLGPCVTGWKAEGPGREPLSAGAQWVGVGAVIWATRLSGPGNAPRR